jgi:hypothetical protein
MTLNDGKHFGMDVYEKFQNIINVKRITKKPAFPVKAGNFSHLPLYF